MADIDYRRLRDSGKPLAELLPTLTPAERAALAGEFVEGGSGTRTDLYGGYPSQWRVLATELSPETLIVAEVDHDDAPELTIVPVVEHLLENEEWFWNLVELKLEE